MHCPYCHVHTSITPLANASGDISGTRDLHGNVWQIGSCNACGGVVMESQTLMSSSRTIYPHPLPSSTAKEIPEEIRKTLIEAKLCASVKAWQASVTMCRRAIQMACIEKGAIASDKLVTQINTLKDKSIITADIHEWATVIRWVGNDGAHPGGIKVDEEDAVGMIDLAEQFLHILYVAPAKAAAHRTKIGK